MFSVLVIPALQVPEGGVITDPRVGWFWRGQKGVVLQVLLTIAYQTGSTSVVDKITKYLLFSVPPINKAPVPVRNFGHFQTVTIQLCSQEPYLR